MLDFKDQRERLVEHHKRIGYIKSDPVERAMLNVKREHFVPEYLLRAAYVDHPLDIGHHQTISAPHMVAIMVEAMEVAPGLNVLEVGGGSGYHAAVIAEAIGPEGHVYSVERIEPLAVQARTNLEVSGYDERVTMLVGDASCGWPEHAPYDRISVACAAPKVPEPMMQELAEGGKLLVPVGGSYAQELVRVTRMGNKFLREDLGGCVFVPLVGKCGF
jgi:protein-L-isoaspartate(D-aspartate) O-methyltransferase